MSSHPLGRRFLKSRTQSWAIYLAQKVSQVNITPNQISVLSVISSLIVACILMGFTSPYKWLLAIIFIQFRLLCNMLDGLVAIEGGKQTLLGDVYNDLPDRLSDIFIILAFGYSVNYSDNNLLGLSISTMAWCASLLAILTAYIRVLFTSLGAPSDYSGPMAKQHRMALISVACLFMFILNINIVIFTAVGILNIGLIITIVKRIQNGVKYILCH